MSGPKLLAKVQKMCEERGISLHKLEAEAGVGNGIIAKWADADVPSLKNVHKVATFFGITIDELLKDSDND